MLSRYSATIIEEALHAAEPWRRVFPPVEDRTAWTALRQRTGDVQVQELIQHAEDAAQQAVEPLPATLYLEFARDGQREGYEHPVRRRRERLWSLTLAECLEADGRFMDPLLDIVWATCEESRWAWPAHQRDLADMQHPVIDLAAAMTALELAEVDALLGSRLHPAVRRRIRAEVNRRCLSPYLARHDHWWLHASSTRQLNNWTAVCNGGVVGAAIYLEADQARLAEIIARAMPSLDEYLETFDPDGGSAEGPGYWSYGFGYYTLLGNLIEQRTGGRVCPLDGERIRQIAQFPLRTLLSPGAFVNFSDCDRRVVLTGSHLAFLGDRLDLPGLSQLAVEQAGSSRERSVTWGLRGVFWQPPDHLPRRWTPAKHDWLSGQQWMIARQDPSDPNALVLAAKGGHNAEPHNQNDIGSFIVHIRGDSVVADPGRGRYTRFYFGPERYEHFVNSSLGHSVPVPNGVSQRAGREYAARLLDHQADSQSDRLSLELKDAYPGEANLSSLQRTLSLQRDGVGRVELIDHVRFSNGPGMLDSVLITFAQRIGVEPSNVTIHGNSGAVRVGFDGSDVKPRVEVMEQVDLAEGPTDIRRVIFSLATPTKEGTIRLVIEPTGGERW